MKPPRRRLEQLYHDTIVNYMRDHPERLVEAADSLVPDEGRDSRSGRTGRGIPVNPRQQESVVVAGVRLQWHGVVPGQYHTLLRITPSNQDAYAQDFRFRNIDEQGRRYATLGAGPVWGINASDSGIAWGSLVSDTNREKDAQPHQPGIPIRPPGGMAEDAFINLMLKTDRDYTDDLNYDVLPHPTVPYRGISPSYNSNSYVAGLLRAVGVGVPKLPVNTPGYNLPLPPRHFARQWMRAMTFALPVLVI